MRRRDFGKAMLGTIAGAGLSASALPELATAQTAAGRPHKKNLKMHVGADYHVIEGNNIISRENLNYNLRNGVTHISPDPDMVIEGNHIPMSASAAGSSARRGGDFIPAEGPMGGAFDLDKLKRMRDTCDSMGMTIEGFRMDSGYIVMKPGPDRERKLDQVCENIRKTREVGVGLISQHWTAIPIRRN